MTELFGPSFDRTDEKSRVLVEAKMRTVGVVVAFQTAIGVCDDPDASAQAKVAAARTLAEMGGALKRADRQAEAEAGGKEIHEMNSAELAAYRRQLERQQLDLETMEEGARSSTTGNAFS
ncbi:MAG: hypothetical protein ACRECY_07290 [Phyllobacterium sp.]